MIAGFGSRTPSKVREPADRIQVMRTGVIVVDDSAGADAVVVSSHLIGND